MVNYWIFSESQLFLERKFPRILGTTQVTMLRELFAVLSRVKTTVIKFSFLLHWFRYEFAVLCPFQSIHCNLLRKIRSEGDFPYYSIQNYDTDSSMSYFWVPFKSFLTFKCNLEFYLWYKSYKSKFTDITNYGASIKFYLKLICSRKIVP